MTYSGSNYRGSASVPGGGDGARVVSAATGGPTRRGLIGSGIGLVASIAAAGGGLAVWSTARSTNDLDRAFDLDAIPEEDRPEKTNEAMNIVVIGSDHREGNDEADARSDTTIIMHVNEGGTEAYGISIPRDLYVYIPEDLESGSGDTENKFNAAYAWGGVSLTVRTVEALTGVRIDHVVEIDFAGLVEVVDALGGVEMNIEPADAPDYYDETGVTSIHGDNTFFPAGPNLLNGDQALDYVRQRYQYAEGDFARMRHQQELIKAIMDSALSAGVLTDQDKLESFIASTSDAVKVDTEFNAVATGINLMNLRSDDLVFLTTPNSGTATEDVGSVVAYDEETAAGLWEALADDRVGEWIEANPEDSGQAEPEE